MDELNMIKITLIILLVLSVYFDLSVRKIPNMITMPAILIGVIWSTFYSGFDGFLFSILGFLIGLTVFIIPYIFGGIGAGDVKLMAAIGALTGWKFTIASSILTALVGGILVILYTMKKGGLKQTLVDALGVMIKPFFKILYMATGKVLFLKSQDYFIKHKAQKENDYIPYAFAISAGTIFVLFYGYDWIIKF